MLKWFRLWLVLKGRLVVAMANVSYGHVTSDVFATWQVRCTMSILV